MTWVRDPQIAPCRRPPHRLFFVALMAMLPGLVHGQKFDGLALTPPMGWNSWNHFGCDIDEELIRDVADAMVSSGMRDAGYEYLNIDDCWHAPTRDAEGRLQPDPARFPSGMRALADYVHAQGLKFGIYSGAGAKTCVGFSGSRDRELLDAATFASWGVDYLKYDWCDAVDRDPIEAYGTMARAIVEAGRPMVLSVCEWGLNRPWEWAHSFGQLWRISGDITNCFDCVIDHGGWYEYGVMQILDQQAPLREYVGPDKWNDPDMMEVGNGLTDTENRAHFSMWAMLSAPLIAGNDVRTMSDATRDILTDKEVIAVNQDALGIQGFRYSREDSLEIWLKPLVQGDWAMALLNRGSRTREVHVDWGELQAFDEIAGGKTHFHEATYTITDLWQKRQIATTDTPFRAEVESHDVRLLRLSPSAHFSAKPESLDLDFWLYPNPAATVANVRVLDPGAAVITVVDVLGRVVTREKSPYVGAGRNIVPLRVQSLPAGTYVVRASIEHRESFQILTVAH